MKKAILISGFLLLLVVVCMTTCPGKQAHQEAIVAKWSQTDGTSDGWTRLGNAVGGGFLNLVLDARLDVQDCVVCSLGQIDGEKIVSVGLLGHVFAVSHEKLDEALR